MKANSSIHRSYHQLELWNKEPKAHHSQHLFVLLRFKMVILRISKKDPTVQLMFFLQSYPSRSSQVDTYFMAFTNYMNILHLQAFTRFTFLKKTLLRCHPWTLSEKLRVVPQRKKKSWSEVGCFSRDPWCVMVDKFQTTRPTRNMFFCNGKSPKLGWHEPYTDSWKMTGSRNDGWKKSCPI